MENGQSTAAKLGLPPLTPEQQEALQKVSRLDLNLLPNALVCLGFLFVLGFCSFIFSEHPSVTEGNWRTEDTCGQCRAACGFTPSRVCPTAACFGLELVAAFWGARCGICCWGGEMETVFLIKKNRN